MACHVLPNGVVIIALRFPLPFPTLNMFIPAQVDARHCVRASGAKASAAPAKLTESKVYLPGKPVSYINTSVQILPRCGSAVIAMGNFWRAANKELQTYNRKTRTTNVLKHTVNYLHRT